MLFLPYLGAITRYNIGMDKELTKTEEKAVGYKNPLDNFKLKDDPEALIKKASKIVEGKEDNNLSDTEKLQLVFLNNLKTGYAIVELVREVVAPRALSFYRELCDEYDCETPSERALAQLAVVSFERSLDCSRRLKNVYSQGETTDLLNKYMALTSTEQDRANRQYISAISTLKQLKSPPMQVNVRTNTAFVAQNQQVNAVKEEPARNCKL